MFLIVLFQTNLHIFSNHYTQQFSKFHKMTITNTMKIRFFDAPRVSKSSKIQWKYWFIHIKKSIADPVNDELFL